MRNGISSPDLYRSGTNKRIGVDHGKGTVNYIWGRCDHRQLKGPVGFEKGESPEHVTRRRTVSTGVRRTFRRLVGHPEMGWTRRLEDTFLRGDEKTKRGSWNE